MSHKTEQLQGMGTAAVLAAIQGGAACVHTAMNGLGERTGNAPAEEVVMALEVLCNVRTGVDLSKIGSTSKLVEQISKQAVGANKAIVGSNLALQERQMSSGVCRSRGRMPPASRRSR